MTLYSLLVPKFVRHMLKKLRDKCPNTEFFLVRIFLYSGLNTEIYGVNLHIKSDTEEYGPEKICIWTLFTQ